MQLFFRGWSLMKASLTSLIPAGAQIEISDIGYLFWRYAQQNPDKTLDLSAREWFQIMNEVSLEECGRLLEPLGRRDA